MNNTIKNRLTIKYAGLNDELNFFSSSSLFFLYSGKSSLLKVCLKEEVRMGLPSWMEPGYHWIHS